MPTSELILPGDSLPQLSHLLESTQSSTEGPTDTSPPSSSLAKPKTLRLGYGLTLSHSTPSTPILPYIAGTLHLTTSAKRDSASILSTVRHYNPTLNDPVLVILLRTQPESFVVQLTPYTPPAVIPFQNYVINNAGTTASVRKSRPNLAMGATIYARVSLVHKHLEAVELAVPGPPFGEVVSVSSKKSGSAIPSQTTMVGGVGVKKTDYIMNASQALIRILMAEETLGKVLLTAVSQNVAFEMIVGKNGRVWIDGESQRDVIKVVRCFTEFDNEEMWNDTDGGEKRVREMVKKICGR